MANKKVRAAGAAYDFLEGLAEVVQTSKKSGSNTVAKIGDLPPVEGQPAVANIPDVGKVELGGNSEIARATEEYTAKQGIDYKPPTSYQKVDEDLGERTADFYEEAESNIADPKVKNAYQEMSDEIVLQYENLLDNGYSPYFIGDKDPYEKSPYLSLFDISQNKRLGVFPTSEGFGTDLSFDPTGHPLLQQSGHFIDGKPALVNDLFRFVHDAKGHAKRGVGFRAAGERNAFLDHFATLGEDARKALTTETQAQNSWLNFGPNGAANRTASLEDTVFANQKQLLLPNNLMMEGTGLQADRQKRITSMLKNDSRNLEGSLGQDGSFQLVDYSGAPLKTTDPKGQELGFEGLSPIDPGKISNKVRIPAAQMYDAVNDPDNLKLRANVKKAKGDAQFQAALEKEIDRAGFSGFFTSHPDMRMVAKVFEPIETETGKAARKGRKSEEGSARLAVMIPMIGVGAGMQKLQGWSEEKQKDNSILSTILMDNAVSNDMQSGEK